MDPYAQLLLVTDPLRAPLLQAAVQALRLQAGSRGLDAGCGLGLQTRLLAQAVGPAGRVTGLDASASFLAQAQASVLQWGLAGRVSFDRGDWMKMPFDDQCFDWAWSADAAGYAAAHPGAELRELARVVKPGGTVAVLCWSSQVLLPGYPALEARLNATRAGIAPFNPEASPGQHYLRLLGWLRAAGLQQARVQTLVQTVFAPLAEELRLALSALFEMRWGAARAEVSPEDWTAYQRLCRPASADFILNCPDYYGFFTCSLFTGEVPPE